MRSHLRCVVLCCAAGSLASANTLAQSVITTDSGWTVLPAGGLVPNPYSNFVRSDNADLPTMQQAFSPINANPAADPFGVNRLGMRAGAFNNGNGITDEYNYQLRWARTFTLGSDATVYMPAMLNAVIGANRGGAGGFCGGTITGQIRLQREDTAGAGDWAFTTFSTGFTHNISSNGELNNQQINSVWDGSSFNTPGGARRYRAVMTLSVSGLVTIFTPPGAAVGTVATFGDGDSAARGGFMGSIAAIPENFSLNSRQNVRAPEARQKYNVTGDGVRVGVIETGEIYTNHSAIDAARIDFQRGGEPAADHRREHALFTSSIIGGAEVIDTGSTGVAPGVTFRSAPLNSYANSFSALQNMILNDIKVINMSASAGAYTANAVDAEIIAAPRVTFVVSAGNAGRGQAQGGNSASNPALSWNVVTVGALNRDFTQRADFSSFNGGNVLDIPTIVAPGEYIQGASLLGTNGNAAANAYRRVFAGNDFDHTGGAAVGAVSGTSFSAPHVSGVVALVHEYAADNAARYDADAIDHRVMKAVLVNAASTRGIFRANADGTRGDAWAQSTNNGAATPASALVVERSLDPQLGGGNLDALNTLRTFASGEVRRQDNNNQRAFTIDATAHLGSANNPGHFDHRRSFWDLERIGARAGMDNGMVDYLLGDITGSQFRATLNWDRVVAGNLLAGLELRFYMDGLGEFNEPGFDEGDRLLASTVATVSTENVKLLDFTIPNIDITTLDDFHEGFSQRRFYLQVVNISDFTASYGLVVQIPTPGAVAIFAFAAVGAARRRRRV